MLTQIRRTALVLGILAHAACSGSPQAPAPVTSPQASQSAATTPPVTTTTLGQTNTYPSIVSGPYTLTLDIGSGCAVVPQEERIRKYTARIDDKASGIKVVTLSDANFLTGLICTGGSQRFSGIGCNQFFASEDIDTMQFSLENNNDEAHGGHIVERLSSGGWVEIIGSAAGNLALSSMEASGTSSVWYCPTSLTYPFPCKNPVSCRSPDMRLTLTQK